MVSRCVSVCYKEYLHDWNSVLSGYMMSRCASRSHKKYWHDRHTVLNGVKMRYVGMYKEYWNGLRISYNNRPMFCAYGSRILYWIHFNDTITSSHLWPYWTNWACLLLKYERAHPNASLSKISCFYDKMHIPFTTLLDYVGLIRYI